MAYDASDPRSALSKGEARSAVPTAFGTAEYVKFYETPPQVGSDVESTWLARGQHMVVAYSEVRSGAVLSRADQEDEYCVLLVDPDSRVSVATADGTLDVVGRRVLIVPPGKSSLTVERGSRLVRVFTSQAEDLAAASANAASYASPKPNVAPLEPWPEPPAGYRLRSYELDVPVEPGRFGRIWRSRSLMINHSEPRPGPRDVTKMSPHVHADFEQGSLVLDGSFVHHIRWPWTTDLRTWRVDEHEICAGPSLTVIPPGAIHTSQQVGTGVNQLVDLFAPPRSDFSAMPGWVLNADDYPVGEVVGA